MNKSQINRKEMLQNKEVRNCFKVSKLIRLVNIGLILPQYWQRQLKTLLTFPVLLIFIIDARNITLGLKFMSY